MKSNERSNYYKAIVLFLILVLLFAFLMVALQPVFYSQDARKDRLRRIIEQQRRERKTRPTETVAACDLGVCA